MSRCGVESLRVGLGRRAHLHRRCRLRGGACCGVAACGHRRGTRGRAAGPWRERYETVIPKPASWSLVRLPGASGAGDRWSLPRRTSRPTSDGSGLSTTDDRPRPRRRHRRHDTRLEGRPARPHLAHSRGCEASRIHRAFDGLPLRDLLGCRSRLHSPLLLHVQRDDELFPRQGALDLFETFSSVDKTLVIRAGHHSMSHWEDEPRWRTFIADRLLR